ncbi:MAG: ATP-binding protein [Candidatus Kapabacteria bacterium]|nr:ATP-binding protein [Candidatus Kapabacteria bacterium]
MRNLNTIDIIKKTALIFSITVVLAISLLGHLFISKSRTALIHEIGNNYKNQAKLTMNAIELKLLEIKHFTESTALNIIFNNKLNSKNIDLELQYYLDNNVFTHSEFLSAILVDENGKTIFESRLNKVNILKKNYKDMDWFKSVINSNNIKIKSFFDNPHFETVESDKPEIQKVIISFSSPIFDDKNKLIGVLCLKVDFNSIVGAITKKNIVFNNSNGINSYQIAILDSTGLILNDNLDPNDILKFNLKKLKSVTNGFAGNNGFEIENNLRKGYEQLNGYASSSMENGIQDTGWVCLVRVQTEEAFKSISELIYLFIVICLVISIALIFVIYLISKTINDIRNIEHEKKHFNIIEKHQLKLKNIIDTVLNAVIKVDVDGKIIEWNSQAENIFGWKRDEIIGMNLSDTIIPHKYRERHKIGFNRFLNTGKGEVQNRVLELSALNKLGNEFPIELILSSYKDENGYEFNAFIRDITDRKNAENEIIKAKEKAEESDRLKTAFLANMSHEVRTPLNAIIGFSNLLTESDLTQEERIEFSEILKKRSNDILNIVIDILDISKIQSSQFVIKSVEGSLFEMVEEVISKVDELNHEDSGVKFILKNDLFQDDYIINTDFSILKRAIINLLDNAFKFTHIGKVELRFVFTNENTLIFSVADTGIGIAPENKELIFGNFRQVEETLNRNYEGIGLGLSISKGLVELLDGRIWFESQVNIGSTFFIEIPLR